MLIKRLFDILCAACGLIVLFPLLLLVASLIKLTTPGPVFFRQLRVGQYQRNFRIHKFRTMRVNAEADGLRLTVGKDPRISWIGSLLRKAKIDELPQLIDVLRGKMSLVGPRPEVPEYVKHYPEEVKAIIFKLKPGITEWGSLQLIDENEFLAKQSDPERAYIEELLPLKLAYGVKYVTTRTFCGDIYLILLTFAKIFTR